MPDISESTIERALRSGGPDAAGSEAGVAREIEKRGTLDVLRKGIHDAGARIRLVLFHPPTGLSPDLQTKYGANRFAEVRRLEYSVKDRGNRHRRSIDMAIFLNGIPLFAAELKNPLTGRALADPAQPRQDDGAASGQLQVESCRLASWQVAC